MNKDIFTKRMIEVRQEKGLKQEQLAQILNVRQNTISRWESGEREPSKDMLISIAIFFNVSIDYLFGLTDELNPNWVQYK